MHATTVDEEIPHSECMQHRNMHLAFAAITLVDNDDDDKNGIYLSLSLIIIAANSTMLIIYLYLYIHYLQSSLRMPKYMSINDNNRREKCQRWTI